MIPTLEQLKAELRVVGTDLDVQLTNVRAAVLEEARLYLNRESLPADEPTLYTGIVMLARAQFDADNPDQIAGYRRAAETILTPLRVCMGM